MRRKMGKADVWVWGVLVCTGLLVGLLWPSSPKKAQRVQIWADGVLLQELPIHWEGELPIDTHLGHNCIRMEKGEVWMVEADCPGGVCIRAGKISRSGQALVCLPHRISVLLVGEDGEVDIVAS